MSVLNVNGVSAVARRQLYSLLSNPLGYVFIFAFVVIAGAFLFLPDVYYTRNIADFGPLFTVMPWLLVILLPALAMGSWATERELGTEELLLTLPFSILDAVLGKFLAVVGYFTIALLCSLTNLIVLSWLGTPDTGLILANYVGWWLAGVAFAGFGVLASVQVGMPAIAFVVGAAYCAILMMGARMVDWFDPFNRGVIPFGGVITALAAAVAALGVAVFMLSSRRWRPTNTQQIAAHVVSVAFGLLLAVNVGRLAYLKNVDTDVSSEGLSSISATSSQVIRKVEHPVIIHAFISTNLPDELQLKAKEVSDKLFAIERSSGGKVEVKLLRPENALDAAGQRATKEFGLKPQRAIVDSVSGRKPQDVFLCAAVVSGSRSQSIAAFDPGLSVEYELVRAVRTVGSAKRPVIGIGATDLKITAEFDFQSGQMRPAWELIEELKKQYEVREVSFDADVPEEVQVLIVPLPSSLTQPQVEKLHDYVWSGRPALLLDDPLPAFTSPMLAPSQPKKPASNPMMMQQQQQPPEQKADMGPFYRALGLNFNLESVLWSDYNPSHQFRGTMPPAIVWVMRDQQSIESSTITTGIDSVVLPFPGSITIAEGKPESLKVTPLLRPSLTAKWGRHPFSEYFKNDQYGQLRQNQPKRFLGGADSLRPALAVEVTGIMPSAYPKADPSAKPPADGEKQDDPTKVAEPASKAGVPSTKPIRVIVVADTDFVANGIFELYRNAGNQLGRDEMAVLRNLRNVQFMANAVDALASDEDFLALRNRRPLARPLTLIDEVKVQTDNARREQLESASNTAEIELKKAQDEFQKATERIDALTDLDENAKEQLKVDVVREANRKLQKAITDINYDKDVTIRNADITQDQTIQRRLLQVKWFAVGIPACVMLILVLAVASLRLRSERSHIPASRKRSQP
ncbi:MAG: Gldg family protein [Planctomycetes bacterium]|nr:Gldg family protein [Planctomycetota bacterium]